MAQNGDGNSVHKLMEIHVNTLKKHMSLYLIKKLKRKKKKLEYYKNK